MTETGESDETPPPAEADEPRATAESLPLDTETGPDGLRLKGSVRRASASEVVPASGAGSTEPAGAQPYLVQLPTFEGPLDLLLHLIQKHELDILDIPIAFVTEKYVEYIRMMQELSIDIASEYLVMAATLAHIKSKMLLPAVPEEHEEADEIEEDPRTELVRRLLEYQKYKEAADQLGSRSLLGRDVFSRGLDAPSVDGPAPLAPVSMFKLLDALQTVLDRVRQTQDHEIDFERISITDRINQLADVLRRRRRLSFDELFEADRTPADVIVTFLALLEMTRIRLTRIWQAQPYAPIEIELAVTDDEAEVAEGPSEADQPAGPLADASPLVEAPAQSPVTGDAARSSEVVVPTEAVVFAGDPQTPGSGEPSEDFAPEQGSANTIPDEHGEEEGDQEP